ncbi:RING finger protein 151 isoform X1 [Rhinichthys klamathensis goyatoka]|uniref:RING finger protein 151 isoform X1 n=1 Tax=Rhinichthys klamathensis goyatoka TaxID=3034132 RepID=UPI0024B62707|nr:RING finger protein 151 isoform X1 [Rhinichthys klamathensis goyatoka]XP_056123784.1 RING finger protein 151 isoform X1 [Rhinichthys klamathensis goyatoka]XP_056123785.1 RING finger protein 151 isoform X1 [Rhinichthys klamathensis goyatoka]
MGYDLERFVGYVNEGLLCCVCRDVLEDPLQAPCEHAFCSSCIHGWLIHHNSCPEDRLPLDITHLRPLFRYMRNDLARLQLRCVFRPQGCEVICALESIHRHEQQCDYALLNCSNAGDEYLCYRCGCPVQVSRRSLEAHLCVCEYSSRVCASGCGYTILNNEEAQHNCVSELRAELDMLRAELDCKVEEVRHEMESRLDSQRRHMVQKENLLRNEVDELKGQLSRVMSDVRILLGAERARRQELERAELEKAELLELLKREGLRPATPSEVVAPPPAEVPRKPSPRSLALDCIKRKNREVTVI